MRHAAACFALLILSPLALAQGEAPAVKKSEQGICHERGSATYERTKHFEPYDTMDACLASGGRVAKNVSTEDADASGSSASSWLGALAKKALVIVGMLVIVGGAYLLSRRRSSATSIGASHDELERKRWDGNRRE